MTFGHISNNKVYYSKLLYFNYTENFVPKKFLIIWKIGRTLQWRDVIWRFCPYALLQRWENMGRESTQRIIICTIIILYFISSFHILLSFNSNFSFRIMSLSKFLYSFIIVEVVLDNYFVFYYLFLFSFQN